MISESPPFWWTRPDWRAFALAPFAAIYGAVAARRMDRAAPGAIAAPVLCIGNFTVGGAGKTPTAIAMARAAAARGRNPGFVSRGHGGLLGQARLVDPEHDSASAVGDEPLLLAAVAPTAIGVNRLDAANALIAAGCDFIVMDDGFQSRRLAWDFALVVVDAAHGLGNGFVIPAGPMRAPLGVQARHADALLVVGDGGAAAGPIRACARAAKPVYAARLEAAEPARFAARRCLAFCGIGHPSKFLDTLAANGGQIVGERIFPDHHAFSEEDCRELAAEALALDATPVTTAKDHVRLASGRAEARALAAATEVLAVEMAFEPEGVAEALVQETIDRFRAKKF